MPTFPILLNKAPLRRFDPASVHNIALLKLDHIGDAVMALPAIEDVRRRFPDAFILLICASWTRELFAETVLSTHAVDDLAVIDYFHARSASGPRRLSPAELAAFTSSLKHFNLDLAIDLRRHPDSRPVLDAIPARWKLAYGEANTDSSLGLPSASDTARADSRIHLGDELRLLMHAYGSDKSDSMPYLRLNRDRVRKLLRTKIPGHILARPVLIGLAPGAGHPMKCWPMAYFSALADLFAERLNAGILWFGSQSEAGEIAHSIGNLRLPEYSRSLAGSIGIMDFAHIATACTIIVGNDSGPGHLAAASGAATLTVFSGQVSPFGVAASGRHSFVLRSKPACAPCFLQEGQCPHDRVCLNAISPEIAFRAANIIMKTDPLLANGKTSGRALTVPHS